MREDYKTPCYIHSEADLIVLCPHLFYYVCIFSQVKEIIFILKDAS